MSSTRGRPGKGGASARQQRERRALEREQERVRGEKWARSRQRRKTGFAVLAAVGAITLAVTLLIGGLGGGGQQIVADEVPPVDTTCPEPPAPPAEPLSFESPPAAGSVSGTVQVDLTTSCGDITLALDADSAPAAVASFDFLAGEGFFDGVPCHRLLNQGPYVLQCGDPTGTGFGGPGYSFGPVENAPDDQIYPAGTIAMARAADDAASTGSQFFLVYEDSTIPDDSAGGYTVMGTVTEGLDVVRTVAEGGKDGRDVPERAVSLTSVTVSEQE